MASQTTHYLILSGWQGSPDDHWQSHWQRSLPNASRVEQADWHNPDPHSWVAALERQVAAARSPLILVAHSLGCVTVARWAAQAPLASLRKVRGALLVAPADVEAPGALEEIRGFADWVGKYQNPILIASIAVVVVLDSEGRKLSKSTGAPALDVDRLMS